MPDVRRSDHASRHEVVLLGRDAEAGLQLESQERQDPREHAPRRVEASRIEMVPDLDEIAGAVAAGHLAAGPALPLLDEELAVQAAEQGE